MSTDKPIVELRVVQHVKQEGDELVCTSYVLQWRAQGSDAWVPVPVVLKVESEND